MEDCRHNIVFNDKTFKGLKAFIMNKTGDIKKGDLSKWVNIAVGNLLTGHVEEKTTPNTHTQKESKHKELVRFKGLLMNYGLDQYNNIILTEEQLRTAMVSSLDNIIDKRTQDNRIRLLLSHKLMEVTEKSGHKIYDLDPKSEEQKEEKVNNIKGEFDDTVKRYIS